MSSQEPPKPSRNMAIVEYQAASRLIPVAFISMFYGALVSLNMLWNMIKLGPKRFFKQNRRDQRPEVLDNPELGTHHFARMKNIRLHYVANGSEDKPLMLFLHGFPEFWYSWRHQLKEFSKDYRVVAVDMRGYGESDRPQGIAQYHSSKLTGDIKEFIEFIGYKKCILVAHDWGGAVGWLFSTKYPEMVDKLIICNMPNPFAFQKHLQSSGKQFRMSWYMFFFQLPWLPEIMLGSRDMGFLSGMFKPVMANNPEKFTDEDLEAFKYTFKNFVDVNGPLNYYRAAMRFQPDHLKTTKVQCPTLIVWGKKDSALEVGSVEPSKKYVNNECTVNYIEDAGHWVQQEAADRVNQYMRQFLGKFDAKL